MLAVSSVEVWNAAASSRAAGQRGETSAAHDTSSLVDQGTSTAAILVDNI